MVNPPTLFLTTVPMIWIFSLPISSLPHFATKVSSVRQVPGYYFKTVLKIVLLPKILQQAAALKPQDPLDPASNFGALINEDHLQKVLGYIDSGEKEGAKLILGGSVFTLIPAKLIRKAIIWNPPFLITSIRSKKSLRKKSSALYFQS